AGGVNPRDSLARHREHSERVRLAKILLRSEWEPREVGKIPQGAGVRSRGIEALTIARDVVVGVREGPAQPLELQGADLVDRGALDRLELVTFGWPCTRLHDPAARPPSPTSAHSETRARRFASRRASDRVPLRADRRGRHAASKPGPS